MKRELETKRYLLRVPKIEDAEEIYEKWGSDKEKIAEYKYHNVHKNIIETRTLLKAAVILSSILEKIGMKREGILRNRMINNNGEKINKIIYSILKEEWENY